MTTGHVLSHIHPCPFGKVPDDKYYSNLKKKDKHIHASTEYPKPFSNATKMIFLIVLTMGALCLSAFTVKNDMDNRAVVQEVGSPGPAGSAPNLGKASTFGIIATVVNDKTRTTHIYGDVSLYPDSQMTEFPSGKMSGTLHINNAISAKARLDFLSAYNDLASRPAGKSDFVFTKDQDLSGLILVPGIYTSTGKIRLSNDSGPLILDAQDNINAVWIFQIGSSMTTTTGNIVLANGAQAKNVFWQVTQDATLGMNTIFAGTIISGKDVTLMTGATVTGRILAGATTYGTIALQNNVISVPSP